MRAILSCGGTGGHIYPAIAIADKIMEREPDSKILFIGTKKGMENRLVPNAGYEIKGIDASGFNRRSIKANFKTIHNLRVGGTEAHDIIENFKPDVVIGTGGYVTGTVLLQAHRLKYPCFIHEQNAVPGVANKIISDFADGVFVSFKGTENSFTHKDRVVYSGNPIRKEFLSLQRAECRAKLGLSDTDVMILATGGSLGADELNKEIMQLVEAASLPELKIYFVTGKRYYEDIKAKCPKGPVEIIDYAENMPLLMKAADLVISRAGAIAVSEITACGKPAILVPSPNVTNNHQFFNAKAIADEGAAILLEEKDLYKAESVIATEVLSLLARPESLSCMAERALSLGKTDAADVIYEQVKNKLITK